MVIGYIRVSTEKQNVSNQKDEILRFASLNDWTIDRWVTEVVSGKRDVKSRKLGKVLRHLRRGDTLVVTEVSRLSRSLTEIMAIMGVCVKKGVNIYTTKERYKFDDSLNSKILCFAFGLVAEIERNLISLRTKEALALRKSEGKILGRPKGSSPKLQILLHNHSKIQTMLQNGSPASTIYRHFKVSKDTWYKYLRYIEDLPYFPPDKMSE